MLILKRKKGEAIRIGDDIVLRVGENQALDLQIGVGGELINIKTWPDGRAVRVGIAAPEHIKILRDELEDNVQGPTEEEICEHLAQLAGPSF